MTCTPAPSWALPLLFVLNVGALALAAFFGYLRGRLHLGREEEARRRWVERLSRRERLP